MASDHFDLVVVGASLGGIGAAVRAAREGLHTVLVTYGEDLGGCAPSLGALESLYGGARSPIFDEFKAKITAHYVQTYGESSPQYDRAMSDHYSVLAYEPHVAKAVLEDLVLCEPDLTVHRCLHVSSVERAAAEVDAVTFESTETGESRRVSGEVFVDATYEGDLAAAAGASYRVGRESRAAFGEPHAGRQFTRIATGEHPREAVDGDLELQATDIVSGVVFSGSTGEGDAAIQAYNFRLCLSSDPDNRRLPEKPLDYDRTRYLGIVEDAAETVEKRYPLHYEYVTTDREELDLKLRGNTIPNGKLGFNMTNLVGGADAYPEADCDVRDEITRRHRTHALGLLYFLQNDDDVPEDVQENASEWGLATDEYVDNGNVPERMYVREARRIVGGYTLSEHDARVTAGLDRTPIHDDAIAFAGDWYMDSHSCTPERKPGSAPDGKHALSEVTRPFSVPYRSVLPQGFTNMLVPVTLSATHVAWGAIRLEPIWMHIGESVGYAAVLAAHSGVSPAEIDVDALQRELVEHDVMISFLNDCTVGMDEPWVPAVQYFGTKGFFRSYNAAPSQSLDRSLAREWIGTVRNILNDELDATDRARRLPVGSDSSDPIVAAELLRLLETHVDQAFEDDADLDAVLDTCGVTANDTLDRGDACRILWQYLLNRRTYGH